MHRNTYLLVSTLAVIAALVVGVNIGRQFGESQVSVTPSITPTPTLLTTATRSYKNAYCKIAFDYPGALTVLENASGSAAFTGADGGDGMLLMCQKDIPRPEGEGEDVRIGSVAATLYHDSVDTLIFRHPGTKLDVLLAGSADMIRSLLSTFRLLP